ncbi:MAG: HAMP domain-containing histidine kinase [Balneolaceae bacterium]|nr:HAMP domain-containing histidine kinase [Balneolaceae bacterium]MBO6544879.1 HAMP domain-containing histidine kinase [Balneolaceae bacterium]MBO6646275.1 HAMP domain-containing histidine kinase [Balneolaceae bacterium]
MFRSKAFRWALLGIGLISIIALTGMNVYSLYDIRDRMVVGEEERQLALLEDLVSEIRYEIYDPFTGLGSLELEPTENTISSSGKFPPQVQEKIVSAAKSSLFDGIYYTPAETDPCTNNTKVYSYNYDTQLMDYTDSYPSKLCDGVGLARTKAQIELNSFEYRWNTNTEFDAHRTMNISFVNLKENRIIGYLTASLNKEYIVNDLIAPKLVEYFDPKVNPGTVLWLHDWANNEVLATNNPSINYDREIVDARRGFIWGNMFENWNIKIAYLDNPVGALYDDTLFKNLFVLGVAVLFVIGALLFMFFTAQKERNLSQRQAGFLANVTHELKTPLAVMQAAGENISDGRVTESARLKEYGTHIYNESIRLRGMIEKLLDVAKTDSGQTLIKAIPINLNQWIKEYLKENRTYIEEKGFNVTLKYSMDQALVMVDTSHLETVLSNLIENAIKYSGEGKKEIRFRVQSEQKNMVLIVSDTGIGIPKKHQKNIFKKFYRVEDSLNAKTKGHGLGLSIVKNLIELNGGTISVMSEVGKGTTFTLRFSIFVREDEKLKSRKENSPTKTVIKTSEYA